MRAGRANHRAYNSIYVIDHDGSVLSIYDKLHLVPFGEFLPFQDWMEKIGLVQLTRVQADLFRHEAAHHGNPACAPRATADLLRGHLSRDVVERNDRPG